MFFEVDDVLAWRQLRIDLQSAAIDYGDDRVEQFYPVSQHVMEDVHVPAWFRAEMKESNWHEPRERQKIIEKYFYLDKDAYR
jgi:hypothetical protein